MKLPAYILLFLILPGLFACTEPYDADIRTDQKILVVDGYLDNQVGNSYVKLSVAIPYDSTGIPQRVTGASVSVHDNTGTAIPFKETSAGYYKPLKSSFAGEINKSYTLTVNTPDGLVYVSKSEKMMPQLNPIKVSGGYNKQEIVIKDYYGNYSKKVTDFCEIYYDFSGESEEIPRFRFTSSQLAEYIIYKELPIPKDTLTGYWFYCWLTTADNNLRFTNEKYPTNSVEVKNQTVCTTNPDKKIQVCDMNLKTLNYDDTVITIYEFKRIVKINQFRLNEDSYTFYKGVENQAEAEGKMFDPSVTQLYGNITCQTDPGKIALGFFEVSSVSTLSWIIDRNGPGTPVKFSPTPNFTFPSDNFTINHTPAFWIK